MRNGAHLKAIKLFHPIAIAKTVNKHKISLVLIHFFTTSLSRIILICERQMQQIIDKGGFIFHPIF
jgi:hypothetical protein